VQKTLILKPSPNLLHPSSRLEDRDKSSKRGMREGRENRIRTTSLGLTRLVGNLAIRRSLSYIGSLAKDSCCGSGKLLCVGDLKRNSGFDWDRSHFEKPPFEDTMGLKRAEGDPREGLVMRTKI